MDSMLIRIKLTNEMNFAELSNITYGVSQNPVVDNLIHYRNISSSPENFIIRRVDYSKMKIYDEKYRKESERLKSLLKSCINNNYNIYLMAKTGMYYKENPPVPDQVSCIYCQGVFSNWKQNDVPLKRHKFSYPTCPYIINLNVGNVPLPYESCKSSNEDRDVDKPTMTIHYTISIQNIDIVDEFLDRLDTFDIDYREEQFSDFAHLKYLAFQGLYVTYKESVAFLKCCSCQKEMPILQCIEKLDNNLLHLNQCEYINIDRIIEKEAAESSGLSNDFCEVEYSITSEEIDARIDRNHISQILKTDNDRELVRSIIKKRLENKGTDFDSRYELIQALRNGVKNIENKHLKNRKNFPLAEFSCVVCLDNQVSVIFLPCGHLKTCASCSELMKNCPVCRDLIIKRVKNFRFKDEYFLEN